MAPATRAPGRAAAHVTLPAARRDESPAVQVPLSHHRRARPPADAFGDESQPGWRMELPDGRAFALTDALRRPRRARRRPSHRRRDRRPPCPPRWAAGQPRHANSAPCSTTALAPLGVLTPDARGEGDEDESGMTDILIRCYEPHDRLRALLDNLTRVTRSPYNVIFVAGKRSAVRNQNVGLDRALHALRRFPRRRHPAHRGLAGAAARDDGPHRRGCRLGAPASHGRLAARHVRRLSRRARSRSV